MAASLVAVGSAQAVDEQWPKPVVDELLAGPKPAPVAGAHLPKPVVDELLAGPGAKAVKMDPRTAAVTEVSATGGQPLLPAAVQHALASAAGPLTIRMDPRTGAVRSIAVTRS